MSQIIDMILDRIVTQVTTTMITNVSDITQKASLVKKGLLQVNKVEKRIEIGVTGGDHEDPDYQDSITSLQRLPDIAQMFAAREVGGGQMWWRRGVCRLECFLLTDGLQESLAFARAYDILGRLESTIENVYIADLVDDYGERGVKIYCYGNTFFESGGPPTQYIFRGKVFWQALTERDAEEPPIE